VRVQKLGCAGRLFVALVMCTCRDVLLVNSIRHNASQAATYMAQSGRPARAIHTAVLLPPSHTQGMDVA